MKFSLDKLSSYELNVNPSLKINTPNNKTKSNRINKQQLKQILTRNNTFQNETQNRNGYLPIKVQIRNSTTNKNNKCSSYLGFQKKINPVKINNNINNPLKDIKRSRNYNSCENMEPPIFIMKNCNYNKVYNININENNNKKNNENINVNEEKTKINKQKLLDANLINYTYNKPKTSSIFGNYQNFAKKINNNDLNKSPDSYNSNSNNFRKKTQFNSLSFNNKKTNNNNRLLNQNTIESIYIDFGSEKKSNPKNENKLLYESPDKIKPSLINQKTQSSISCSFKQKIKNKFRFSVGSKRNDTNNMRINTENYIFFDTDLENDDKNLEININDLILFEGKINNILSVLSVMDTFRNGNIINITEECKEFLVFYFESSLKGKFTQFFDSANKIIVESSINLYLFCIILCYHLSDINFVKSNVLIFLKEIFNLIKINFLLYVKQLLFKTNNEKINKIFSNTLMKNKLFELTSEEQIIKMIFDNCRAIMTNNLNKIITIYRKTNANYFTNDFIKIFNNISITSEKDLENYFYKKLLYNTEKTKKNNLHPIPLLPISKNDKKYSLILSLDKTLIYINEQGPNKINYQFRPGLFSFLSMLKPYYEIISYTNNPKDYASQIIHHIEFREKYFDYSLYKENMITKNFNYFENISLIGRDAKNILIIDNNYDKYFEPNKENKINIFPYFGDKTENDCALFALKKILILIYKNKYNDLRIAIKDYEKDIKENVSLEENI